MRYLGLVIWGVFFSMSSYSQLRYPIIGTYKTMSAQGMAIWDDNAYLFNDGGHCRVLSLVSGRVQREFNLASAGEKTHVNAACFGLESTNGSTIPVIYISEYNLPSRCFVESIGESANTLVQTIQAQENGKTMFVQSWIVDGKEKSLYAIARTAAPKGEKNSSKVRIIKYRLPLLNEGKEILLSEKDIQESFYVEFASGTQGGAIKGKYLYLPTGLPESSRGKFNAERVIQVIDLKKKSLVKRVDLTYITTNEPCDMDFYKGKSFLYCGQEGGIYQVKM